MHVIHIATAAETHAAVIPHVYFAIGLIWAAVALVSARIYIC